MIQPIKRERKVGQRAGEEEGEGKTEKGAREKRGERRR